MPFSIPPVNAPLAADYTAARAALLDRLALLLAGGAGELTPARAALLANLDAAVSSRPAAADYTAARAAALDTLRLGVSTVSVIHPTRAIAAAVLSGAGVFTLGAFVELVAATASAGAIVAVVFDPIASDLNGFEIELAAGALGVEVVIGRVRVKNASVTNASISDHMALPTPIRVAAGARLSFRCASELASKGCALWVVYMPTPAV